MEVNGKTYPLWGQFVERKDEWIGGILKEVNQDALVGSIGDFAETEITDIELVPNGDDSALFRVVGKDFSCGFDVTGGGVAGEDWGKGWIVFGTVGMFSIKFGIKGREDHELP